MRAVRADKLTYAALEATLALWAQVPSRSSIPVHRMMTMPVDEIERRATALVGRVAGVHGLSCQVIDGASTAGGGSAPGSALPTRLVAIAIDGRSPDDIDRRLRAHDPPVVARIEHDRVVIDLRTVQPGEDAEIERAIRATAAA
jgi:L-seryl-tRNA(Ser) seleniumtransferase